MHNREILDTIAMVCMVLGPVLFILAWPISEGVVKFQTWREEQKKDREKRQEKERCKTTATGKKIVHNNPYLQKYYDALERKDRDGMVEALKECKDHCSGANSWCLTEMFCPDCPMGGLVVHSGRGEYKS